VTRVAEPFGLPRWNAHVESLRLRKLQRQPSHVERLLEALITRGDLVPDGAYHIRDPASVPAGLRKIADQTATVGRVWSCWADTSRTWLFTAEMSLPASVEKGAPVLQVEVHHEDGASETGAWTPHWDGKWCRYSHLSRTTTDR
jgi:hypothetical protein